MQEVDRREQPKKERFRVGALPSPPQESDSDRRGREVGERAARGDELDGRARDGPFVALELHGCQKLRPAACEQASPAVAEAFVHHRRRGVGHHGHGDHREPIRPRCRRVAVLGEPPVQVSTRVIKHRARVITELYTHPDF